MEFSKFPREAGSSCHGYSGKWPYPDLQGQAAPSRYLEKGQASHFGQHSREIPDFSKSSSLPNAIHLRVGERGHCDKKHPRNSRKSSHKSPFSRPKGHRQDPPYNRPFLHERVCRVPKVQDGASSQDHQGSPEPFVGGKDRHSGRLPVCIDLRLLPKVFLLLDRQRHVHVQTNALRSHNRPFHLHQTDKGHQEVPQKEGSQRKLLYRRLPHMGEHSRKGNSTSQLDSESFKVARLQDKPQEDLPLSCAKVNLLGRRSRSSELDNEPSSRQDKPSSSGVQSPYPSPSGIKKGPGSSHWTSYLFLLGHSHWKNVCYPTNCVDEFAHMCDCPGCGSLCYSLPAEAVETFLSTQFPKSKGLFQDPSPRFGLNDGCFRLWLEWGNPPLLREGYLVGRGRYRLYQRERNESHNLLHAFHASYPGWKACGSPHRQHGSLFLFEENGFSPVPDPQCSYQGISLFLSRSQHYVRGPTYSGKAKCPCRRGLEGNSQCHRQLSGPGDFLVCFKNGLLRFNQGGRFMCYIGEYEVQVLCLAVSGRESVLCGERCKESRLVTVQSDLSFSSCFDPRFAAPEDRGLSGDSAHHSSPYWPCLSDSLKKSPLGKKTPRVFFPFSVPPERRDSRATQVLRLLDVGIVDIPDFSSNVFSDVPSQNAPSTPPPGSPPQVSASPVAPSSPAAPRMGSVCQDLAQIYSNYYTGLGCVEDSLQILLNEHAHRTFRQYQAVWIRFVNYLKSQNIPAGGVRETTVLNYLSSRLKPQGVVGRVVGKLSPSSIGTELYGLVFPLHAIFNITVDLTAKGSIFKKYLTGIAKLPDNRVDLFPTWNLQDLLDYLQSDRFEPLESKPWKICREKALILLMLATGRRLADVSALTARWSDTTLQDGTPIVKFTFYSGWTSKAHRADGWCSKDVFIYAIDNDDQDRSALCPLRAFRLFWDKRPAFGDPNRLWLCIPSFLGRLVIRVIKSALLWANPSTPEDLLPHVGTHNLRKFALSLAFLYFLCRNLQQLWDRVGSRTGRVPRLTYIRNIAGPAVYLCTPLGTLKPGMQKLRFACDPQYGY